MKTNKKLIFSIAIALILCAGIAFAVTLSANAADVTASGTCGDNLTWTLTSDGTLTISGEGKMEDFSYKSSAPWFDNASEITSVVIEDGVTTIGNYAFYGCTSLTSITIPDSVTTIGSDAFMRCKSLTSVTIPDSITSIGYGAFWECTSLTSIMIPDSVTTIGAGAFYSCTSLASITIPDSVTEIASNAFQSCTSLTNIYVDENNTSYSSVDGILFDKYMATLVTYPACKTDTSYTVPDSVTEIDDYAFYYCTSLTSITIPDSVMEIGEYAFYACTSLIALNVDKNNTSYCSVDGVLFDKKMTTLITYPAGKEDTSYVVSNGVTTISKYAFYDCSGLISIMIPDSVIFINSCAFACESIAIINFEGDAPIFEDDAFSDVTCIATYPEDNSTWTSDVMQSYFGSITWVAVTGNDSVIDSGTCGDDMTWKLTNDGVLTISGIGAMNDYSESDMPPWMIYYQGIVSVAFEDNVTSIGYFSFTYIKKLTSIIIPDSVVLIGNFAFYGCDGISSIVIPDSVIAIGYAAFANCTGLRSVAISNSVTSIDGAAFGGCSSLTSITIPDNVTSIGNEAFKYCTSLNTITFEGDAPSTGYNAFYDVTATAYYPEGNSTWTEDVMQDYGGTITWVSYSTSSDNNDDDTTSSGCGSTLTAIPVMLATAVCCVCVKRKRKGRREK